MPPRAPRTTRVEAVGGQHGTQGGQQGRHGERGCGQVSRFSCSALRKSGRMLGERSLRCRFYVLSTLSHSPRHAKLQGTGSEALFRLRRARPQLPLRADPFRHRHDHGVSRVVDGRRAWWMVPLDLAIAFVLIVDTERRRPLFSLTMLADIVSSSRCCCPPSSTTWPSCGSRGRCGCCAPITCYATCAPTPLWFRQHEDIIQRAVNLAVFIFIVTSVVSAGAFSRW